MLIFIQIALSICMDKNNITTKCLQKYSEDFSKIVKYKDKLSFYFENNIGFLYCPISKEDRGKNPTYIEDMVGLEFNLTHPDFPKLSIKPLSNEENILFWNYYFINWEKRSNSDYTLHSLKTNLESRLAISQNKEKLIKAEIEERTNEINKFNEDLNFMKLDFERSLSFYDIATRYFNKEKRFVSIYEYYTSNLFSIMDNFIKAKNLSLFLDYLNELLNNITPQRKQLLDNKFIKDISTIRHLLNVGDTTKAIKEINTIYELLNANDKNKLLKKEIRYAIHLLINNGWLIDTYNNKAEYIQLLLEYFGYSYSSRDASDFTFPSVDDLVNDTNNKCFNNIYLVIRKIINNDRLHKATYN